MKNKSASSGEKVIIDKKMAAYLILKGVPLNRSKMDLKCPKNRVFFFKNGPELESVIQGYKNYREDLVRITLSKSDSNMQWNHKESNNE